MEVAYDPFSRDGLTRYKIGSGPCAWCGNKKKKLFGYQSSNDAQRFGQPDNLRGFCNLECFKDFAR